MKVSKIDWDDVICIACGGTVAVFYLYALFFAV